jgi:hypothetical protein
MSHTNQQQQQQQSDRLDGTRERKRAQAESATSKLKAQVDKMPELLDGLRAEMYALCRCFMPLRISRSLIRGLQCRRCVYRCSPCECP